MAYSQSGPLEDDSEQIKFGIFFLPEIRWENNEEKVATGRTAGGLGVGLRYKQFGLIGEVASYSGDQSKTGSFSVDRMHTDFNVLVRLESPEYMLGTQAWAFGYVGAGLGLFRETIETEVNGLRETDVTKNYAQVVAEIGGEVRMFAADKQWRPLIGLGLRGYNSKDLDPDTVLGLQVRLGLEF